MKSYKYPNTTEWKSLSERPLQNQKDLSEQVKSVFENIKEENHTVKNTLFPAWTKIAAAIAVLIGFG